MKEISFEISTSVYPMEAVYGACYVFTDRVFVAIETNGADAVKVRMRPKGPARAGLRALEGEFRNELLHQAFRQKVSASNRKIREYVVTRALLSAQAPRQGEDCVRGKDPAQPTDDALAAEIKKLLAEVEMKSDQEDPFGITAPWEAQAGKPEASGAAGAPERDGEK